MRKKSPAPPRIIPGAAPGTIRIPEGSPRPVISVMAYDADRVVEKRLDDPAAIGKFRGRWPVVWINVDGFGDVDTLERIGRVFGLHRLVLEDVVNVGQRAKVEVYDEHLFIVKRMATSADPGHVEQVSILLGPDYLLTFQEQAGDCLEPVRERVRQGRGRIRKSGADYLTYAVVDSIIDSYFPVLERIGTHLEEIEDRVVASADEEIVARIQTVKAELRDLRRWTWPHRDVVSALLRDDAPFITDGTRVYLRDCADHAAQVTELVESYRETCVDLMSTYLSSVSNRMNEVMKVLTLVAAIFIPLSFIAGLYGMNFSVEASPWNMPELDWYLGYPLVLLMMGLVAGGMLVYFKVKGWFR